MTLTSAKKRQPNRIDYLEDPILKQVVEAGHRLNWDTLGQKHRYEVAMELNDAREYGAQYIAWLLGCMVKLGPEKGWTLERFITYLESDKKYDSKIPEVKHRKLYSPKGKVNGSEDFLDEAEKLDHT